MPVAPAGDASSAAGGPFLRLLIFPARTLVYGLFSLEKDAGELSRTIDYLRAMKSDAESAAQGSGILRQSVREWMDSVDAISDDVARLLAALDRTGMGCLCSWSYFKLGRDIAEKLREVRLLVSQFPDLGLLVGAPLPEYPSVLLGRERTLTQIRKYLRADNVWVVGIYGTVGSGKTRLMKRIKNELLAAGSACPFEALVWVTVSQEPDVRTIQDVIGTQLGLHLSPSWEESGDGERARILFRALERWRFLLLLDDLWEPLDFEAVGIPHPTCTRYSMIAFTSRSYQVCVDMNAVAKVGMHPLDMETSWTLFSMSVDTCRVNLVSPLIRPPAQRIVDMCGGLPLALVVAGRAMADAETADEWEQAASELGESTERSQGRDHVVLSSLKLSYDRLRDDTLRQCLLYCCLFPEGNPIPPEGIIDYWVGEGLLDDPMFTGDRDAARDRGHSVVEILKSASLLESVAGEDGQVCLEVRDILRAMAMWICSSGQPRSLLLKPWNNLRLLCSSDVVRIAVAGGDRIEEYLKSEFPTCPNLLSLLLSKNAHIDHIPTSFFSRMPLLRVLDLSGTKIRELPEEFGLLTELRYFNLSDTPLRALPACIGRLVKLGQLDLSHTRLLETIPRTAALCTSLEKLDLYNSGYRWPEEPDEERGEGRISLKDLGLLPKLNDLKLDVKSLPALVEILGSNSLPRSISYLTLQHIEDLSQSQLDFDAVIRLRGLCIEECSGLLELTFGGGELCSLGVLLLARLSITKINIMGTPLQSLKQLHIVGCHALRDLSLVHQLPHLQRIELRDCCGLEVLISSATDDASAIFPQVKRITLYALANLKCICHRPLLLPQMEYLEVYRCPMLQKLPLESGSACYIKQIVGAQGWWDMLQWDEHKAKMKFLLFFKDPWQKEVREQEEKQEQKEEGSGAGKR